MSLTKTICKLLKENPNEAYTAREIAEWIVENKESECMEKMKNTKVKSKDGLINQLVAEIGSRKNNLQKNNVSITTERPRKYFYNILNDTLANFNSSNIYSSDEKTLAQKLSEFCNYIGIKTINFDNNSNNWLCGEVLGFQKIPQDFAESAKKVLEEYNYENIYLYSFDIQNEKLNNKNLRQNFFRSVSNSSWANYSYIAAEDIDEDIMEELEFLCQKFKMGFIKIDKSEPVESKILIKAPKTSLDSVMVGYIAKENTKFKQIVKNATLSFV